MASEMKNEAQLGDLRQTFEFNTQTWKEDITLIVENKKLFVASAILALVSPVFSSMLDTKFKEGTGKEIVIEEKTYDEIVEFLRCVYPNILKPISKDNVLLMLPMAHEYKVEALMERCETFLVNTADKTTSAEDLCLYLIQASLYKLTNLREKCVPLVADKSDVSDRELEQAEAKYPLPIDIRLEIKENVIITLRKTVSQLNANLQQEKYETSRLQKKVEHWQNRAR